jgi:hypothetical protein
MENKSNTSKSKSYRTFQLTQTRQDDSSLVVTLTAANPLLGSTEGGYVTQVPSPYDDWGMMMVDQNLVGQCGAGQLAGRDKIMDRYFPDWRGNDFATQKLMQRPPTS